ncbi:MAG TPA: UDP-N-acetylglucosamine 2-epimerase (non-hydrolyzing), partial [Thermoanaerobaculia bacterium]
MTQKKFAVIFGTRPEAIKLAPVIHELERQQQDVVKISTGQHQSMLSQALNYFEIAADHDLGTMREGQTLPELLSRITADSESVLRREKPDVVIVQGDTSTALGSGMAAYFSGLPVAHVEAGLRTYNNENPFPEEVNRSIIARLARWHFCPTDRARINLRQEGIDGPGVQVTGNTVVDALHWGRAKALGRFNGSLRKWLADTLNVPTTAIERFVLVTCHRRENFGQPLADICRAICELERRREDLRIIWPVHLNPNVRQEVERMVRCCGPRIYPVAPVDYETMLALLETCKFILTDSGGIQEEAAVFHKPVLIMRKATERPEIVESGGGMLVGTDPDTIVDAANRVLDDDGLYQKMSNAPNPFGDGHAAERIVGSLLQ